MCLALFLATGCSPKTKIDLRFNTSEPLRVAVLPFYQVDGDGVILPDEASVFILDNIPGLSSVQNDPPPRIVRDFVVQQLQLNSNLDVIPSAVVDGELVHSRMVKGSSFDHTLIKKASASSLCKVLACDAVLRGKVTEWDRAYYGIESVTSVSIQLEMVRATNNEVIFSTEHSDTESRGISKGPTGYTSVVLEPLKGLDSKIIVDLSEQVATKAVEPLFTRSRPEFLTNPPPIIISSAHDSSSGLVSREQPLTVLSYGSPGHFATFSIGDVVRNVVMREKSKGHYIGEFYPLGEDKFENETVVVRLTDSFGRSAEQVILSRDLSLYSSQTRSAKKNISLK
jgi:hypothetical protein